MVIQMVDARKIVGKFTSGGHDGHPVVRENTEHEAKERAYREIKGSEHHRKIVKNITG
jgi:hypothetical protein